MAFEKEVYKYDINTLGKDLGLQPATVRVLLRQAKVSKAGKSYGWNKEADYKAVLKQLKTDKPAAEKKSAEKKTEAPAKGKAKEEPAKKAAPTKKK